MTIIKLNVFLIAFVNLVVATEPTINQTENVISSVKRSPVTTTPIFKSKISVLTEGYGQYMTELQKSLKLGYLEFANTNIPRASISPVLIQASNYNNPFGKLPNLNRLNCSKQSIIYINAFYSTEYDVLKTVKYLKRKQSDNYNIFILNFAENSFQFYNLINNYFYDYAYLVYKLISILETNGCHLDTIKLIGHGHGAQMAALASIIYYENGSNESTPSQPKLLPLIIAIDPALQPIDNVYLNQTVAQTVIAIHSETTNGFGTDLSMGDIDIYLNDVKNNQPGCTDSICNHIFPVYVFIEGILKDNLWSVQCENYEEFRNGNCDYTKILRIGLDYNTEELNPGKYYLITNGTYPRGLGQNGLGCPRPKE